MKYGSKLRMKNRRLFYDGPYANVAPGTKDATAPKRMGAWSPDSRDLAVEQTLGRFPLREISRPLPKN